MRILILHNTYQQAGGEDAVVANEVMLLRKQGHEVHLHLVSNETIQGFWRKVITGLQTSYSRWGRREAKQVIGKTRPDIVHVHNFFPLLTPSIYETCLEAKVPVVQTLHNYRTICAGALLMRDGKLCEDCIQGTPYQAVLHGCYRDSKWGSLAVSRMIDTHRKRGTWTTKVGRFIALTQFSKGKFVEAGFPSEKIVVKPNFVDAEELGTPANGHRKGALFVGRLSQEKGIETLLRAWGSLDFPLRIIGDGPMMDFVSGNFSTAITVLGKKEPRQVTEEMVSSLFLVMPSEWYEGFPMTIVEAFAQGLPVIASRLGAMEEVIEDRVTGLHFTPGDAEDLAQKVRWANEHPDDMRLMGRNARRVYEEKYTPEINYRQLMAIYEGVVKEKRNEQRPGVTHFNRTSLRSSRVRRILILQNSYQYRGGEDVVASGEGALLRDHGHEVHLNLVSNNTIQGFWQKVMAGWHSSHSEWGQRKTMEFINETRPDVVHVHNFFPLLSPSVYDACREAKVPVVQTLHNYRTICPGALLMRDGKPCDDCIQGTPYQAVLHGCYRGSRLGSLASARMVDYHRRQRTWATKVDRFIVLSQFSKGKFLEAGFPSEKIVVKPNFVDAEELGTPANGHREGALFVGRLSQEKGVKTLLRAWKSLDFPLRIVGDGPMMDWVSANASTSITVFGKKEPRQVIEEMERAAFLVVPSEYVGTFGLQIIESFANGLPVITSDMGVRTELVEDGVTGLHFRLGEAEDLVRKVRWAGEHPEEMIRMGRNARRVYEEKYTPEMNYHQLMAIYEEAIEENRLKGYP